MSADRILTTHTGSLPRPDDLIQMRWAKGDGIPVDEAALADRVATAVQETVDKQVAAGISIVNDVGDDTDGVEPNVNADS